MGTVCFDTNVLIWAIKKQASEGQEINIPRANALINHLRKNKKEIIIPSIVLAECCCNMTQRQKLQFADLIKKNFILVPFDNQCAVEYASIIDSKLAMAKTIRNNQKLDVPNYKIKSDYLIVACAKANGAKIIYSHDKNLKLFSEGIIEVSEIPSLPTQPSLINMS